MVDRLQPYQERENRLGEARRILAEVGKNAVEPSRDPDVQAALVADLDAKIFPLTVLHEGDSDLHPGDRIPSPFSPDILSELIGDGPVDIAGLMERVKALKVPGTDIRYFKGSGAVLIWEAAQLDEEGNPVEGAQPTKPIAYKEVRGEGEDFGKVFKYFDASGYLVSKVALIEALRRAGRKPDLADPENNAFICDMLGASHGSIHDGALLTDMMVDGAMKKVIVSVSSAEGTDAQIDHLQSVLTNDASRDTWIPEGAENYMRPGHFTGAGHTDKDFGMALVALNNGKTVEEVQSTVTNPRWQHLLDLDAQPGGMPPQNN